MSSHLWCIKKTFLPWELCCCLTRSRDVVNGDGISGWMGIRKWIVSMLFTWRYSVRGSRGGVRFRICVSLLLKKVKLWLKKVIASQQLCRELPWQGGQKNGEPSRQPSAACAHGVNWIKSCPTLSVVGFGIRARKGSMTTPNRTGIGFDGCGVSRSWTGNGVGNVIIEFVYW